MNDVHRNLLWWEKRPQRVGVTCVNKCTRVTITGTVLCYVPPAVSERERGRVRNVTSVLASNHSTAPEDLGLLHRAPTIDGTEGNG